MDNILQLAPNLKQIEDEPMELDFVTASEAARIIGVTPAAVRWYSNNNRLPVLRTSTGVRFFLRHDVENFSAMRAARRVRRGVAKK
jgi:DNA-binding transcriptional MerR regulator